MRTVASHDIISFIYLLNLFIVKKGVNMFSIELAAEVRHNPARIQKALPLCCAKGALCCPFCLKTKAELALMISVT